MRILVNASRELAHSSAGGSEVFVDHVLSGLVDRGHEVTLSAGGPCGSRPYRVRDSGGTFSQYLRYPSWLLRNRDAFDLVVDVANGMTYYTPLVWSGPTICLVHHVHTKMWAEWFSPPVAAFGRELERRAMPRAYRSSTFVAVSESTRRELTALGVADESIHVVHNATLMPEQPAASTDSEPLFVAVGRLVPHKQFHLLLERWPEVRASTGGRLVIVGEGPERARLRPLLTDGATLVGKVSDIERDQWLARATVLVHPSYVEGWGLVVMEAAAQGTPSIGFDVPGVRDSIVNGETGWVCRTLDDLVARWIAAASDTATTAQMASAARNRAAAFGVEQTVAAFEQVAMQAVARHRRPVPVTSLNPVGG